LLVALCVAEDTVKYAGTTTGAATFSQPVWTNGACAPAPATSQSPYVFFNITFATAGVREVAAMAEQSFKSSITIYVYLGTFDPANPCTNVVGGTYLGQQTGLTGGPVIDDYVYFTAATYQFVVTSSGSNGGLFAVNVFPSISSGWLNSTQTWAYPYVDETNLCTSDITESTPAGWFSWTQTTSGYFDILVTFANTTIDQQGYYFGATVALFQGYPSAAGLAADPCNTTLTGATFLTVQEGEDRGAFLFYTNLTAGWNYTVVFSGEEGSGFTGYWGVQVVPTRIRFFNTNPSQAFNQPNRYDYTQPCAASGNLAGWFSTEFLTEERAYLIDTQDPPNGYFFEGVDTYSFLYAGDNTGVPPTTCPIFAPLVIGGDTGDVTPVYAITDVGVNYTVVVSTYSGSEPDATGATILWLFTGLPIGALPPSTTTGAATTGAATGTTSAPTPATGTTGAPTPATATGTTSAPTPATTSPTPTAGGPTGTTSTTGNKPVTTSTTSSASVASTVGVVAVVAAVASLL